MPKAVKDVRAFLHALRVEKADRSRAPGLHQL